MAEKKQNTSSTALRVLSVMDCLAQFKRPATVAEVCARTGLDRPTGYRALLTLVEAGFATRDSAARGFQLSFKVVSLARSVLAGTQHLEAVRATLRKIADATGETCHYSVLEGFETVTTLREKGTQVVAVDFSIGDREELHCTSNGKALLAHQSEAFIGQVLSRPLSRRTPHTICDPVALGEELARVRKAGLAIDNNEMILDMRCIAVPIFEAGGGVHSGLSISGPASRFTDAYLANLGRVLRQNASELSAIFGYVPSAD